MADFDQDLASHFFDDYNFRPLLLTFDEISAMKAAVGNSEGVLFICPVFSFSEGIPEHIVTLRYVLFKKENNKFVPVRFDFKPVGGQMERYYSKLKNATIPNFEIPQTTPLPPPSPQNVSLDGLFSFVTATRTGPNGETIEINKNDYISFFLQKNQDKTLSLFSTHLTIKPTGGTGPGGQIIVSNGPPKPPQE